MANQLDDIDFLQPDLAEDFVKLMRAYYQRQYAHTIVSDEREAEWLGLCDLPLRLGKVVSPVAAPQ